jgi:hypothetical protein
VEGYFSDIVFENFINKQGIMAMASSPWAFISRRGLREVVLLLLFPTAMFLLSASSMTNAEIIYKPGDWLLYRFTFNFDGWECTYLYRVTVRNIKGTNVLYSLSFEKIEKGDDPSICRYRNLDAILPVRIEVPYTSDISQERPGSWKFFINSAYTGEYKISGTTYRYYKGILTYQEITRPGSELTRIELVDTSIQELKASITPLGMSITMIGLILVVLATIITVIAIFIVVKRRHKTTETPLNQSQAT